MLALYKQFRQGLSVAVCASMTMMTLGWMMDDAHRIEKKQIRNDYENQIRALHDEINKQRLERAVNKINYS